MTRPGRAALLLLVAACTGQVSTGPAVDAVAAADAPVAPGTDAAAADAPLAVDGPPNGADVTFTPAIVPLSDPEIGNPWRGSYDWLGVTPEPGGWPIVDSYVRYAWKQVEPARDSYDFAAIDAELAAAAARGGKFGLRIMPACTGCGSLADSMPAYMHDLMPKGWTFDHGGTRNYAPDWNDPDYLDRLGKLLAALAAHLGDDPRFGFLDVSCYGDWGEWHVWQWPYPAPTGATDITEANAKAIVDLNVAAFPGKRLVMPHDHDAALAHAMSRSPRIGVRNDCLGFDWFTQANTAEAPIIGERWKTAPYITEYCFQNPGSGGFVQSLDQIARFHVAMIGNGNKASLASFSSTEQAAFLEANKRSGYRFELRRVTLPGELGAGQAFTVATTWANVGVTPAYSPWDVELELRDAGGAVAWKGRSTIDLEALLPSATPLEVSDAFVLPAGTAPGAYRLAVVVRDADAYYAPLALAIRGRGADGAYDLGDVTVR